MLTFSVTDRGWRQMELCPSPKLHDCNLVGFKQALTARRKRHNKEYRRRKKNSLMGFNFFPFCPALQCACCGARHTKRANPLAACTKRSFPTCWDQHGPLQSICSSRLQLCHEEPQTSRPKPHRNPNVTFAVLL